MTLGNVNLSSQVARSRQLELRVGRRQEVSVEWKEGMW